MSSLFMVKNPCPLSRESYRASAVGETGDTEFLASWVIGPNDRQPFRNRMKEGPPTTLPEQAGSQDYNGWPCNQTGSSLRHREEPSARFFMARSHIRRMRALPG